MFVVTPVPVPVCMDPFQCQREREGGRERGTHQVFMVTPLSIPVCIDRFRCQREGGREEEGDTSGVCGDTDVYTILYESFPVSKRVINLVFYAHSTSTVISGRERERGGEREKHQVFVVTPVSIRVYMDCFWCQREGGGREREKHQVFVVTPVSIPLCMDCFWCQRKGGGREREKHQVFVVTPVSIPLCMDCFWCQRKGGGRERERQQVFVVTPGVYTTLYGSFPVSERGREGGRGETESSVRSDTGVYAISMNHFQYERELSVLQCLR